MRFHRISLKIFYDGDLLSPPMLESVNGCARVLSHFLLFFFLLYGRLVISAGGFLFVGCPRGLSVLLKTILFERACPPFGGLPNLFFVRPLYKYHPLFCQESKLEENTKNLTVRAPTIGYFEWITKTLEEKFHWSIRLSSSLFLSSPSLLRHHIYFIVAKFQRASSKRVYHDVNPSQKGWPSGKYKIIHTRYLPPPFFSSLFESTTWIRFYVAGIAQSHHPRSPVNVISFLARRDKRIIRLSVCIIQTRRTSTGRGLSKGSCFLLPWREENNDNVVFLFSPRVSRKTIISRQLEGDLFNFYFLLDRMTVPLRLIKFFV